MHFSHHAVRAAALLALGVLAAGIGNVLFWRVLRRAGPVLVATTYQTVPTVAVIVGVVAFGETLGVGELLGLRRERVAERAHRRHELVHDLLGRCDVHRGRERVVRRLRAGHSV